MTKTDTQTVRAIALSAQVGDALLLNGKRFLVEAITNEDVIQNRSLCLSPMFSRGVERCLAVRIAKPDARPTAFTFGRSVRYEDVTTLAVA